jgi:hypothetical protein
MGKRPAPHANRTSGIVRPADPTARGLTGDVDPLAARDICQVSYCKDKDLLALPPTLIELAAQPEQAKPYCSTSQIPN